MSSTYPCLPPGIMSGTYEYHPPSEVRKASEDKLAAGQRFGEDEAVVWCAELLQAARGETARVAEQLRVELGRTWRLPPSPPLPGFKKSLQRQRIHDLIGDLTNLADDLIGGLTNADLSGSKITAFGSYYSDGTIDFTEADLTNADLSGSEITAAHV